MKRLAARQEAARLQSERERREAHRLAEKGRYHLADFVRAAWPIVEPGRPLIWGWHLDAICEHLEAVSCGQILNLIISIPPGTTKSRTAAVFWSAWDWLNIPNLRWLVISNSENLATRDSLACRRLVESDWYQQHYPDAPKLTTDQNVKTWYENNQTGHRQSMGISATVTGKKGDRIVVDDANDAEKVESEAERKMVNGRWDNAIYDRVIDFKKGQRVVIGQRTHRNDLIGHIKETSTEFEELCIPEEFEPARKYFTSIGWTDPRTKEGEWLRPEQFGQVQKENAVKRLGTIGYRAKHQQDPQSKDGYRFKRKWFRYWRQDGDSILLDDGTSAKPERFLPSKRTRFGTADGAASAKTSADYTAISSWVTSPRHDLVWLGCRREQVEIPDQPDVLAEEYKKYGMAWCGVEAVMGNVALYQHARRTSMVIKKLDPDGKDKLTRATPAIVFVESGRLWLPEPELAARIGFPLDAVLAELTAFTGDDKVDEHDDIVDNLSFAVKCLPTLGGTATGRPVSTWMHGD
jgi:hypothetical protein